jgi:uncharacterized protein YkwD
MTDPSKSGGTPAAPATTDPAAGQPTVPAPSETPQPNSQQLPQVQQGQPVQPLRVQQPAPTQTQPAQAAAPTDNSDASITLALVNEERTKAGLGPLTLDPQLSAVADAHAKDMQSRNFFSHDSPEGVAHHQRIINAGIAFSHSGENIAMGQQSAAEAMKGWMESPGHKANIVSQNFGRFGFGRAGIYWVQLFAN